MINKTDRPTPASPRSSTRRYELFLDLDADRRADRVPDRLRLRPRRPRVADQARPTATMPDSARTSSRCSTILLDTVPAPTYDRGRAAAGARHQPRRLAVPRPARAVPGRSTATIRKGQQVAWCRPDGTVAARQDHRAADDRGARPRARPSRPAPATSSPSPASPRSRSARRWPTRTNPRRAAADHRRRAGDLDDDRHQHLAAGRPGQGHQADRPAW